MSNDNHTLSVTIRSDGQGHWVEWYHGGENGRLGPYHDLDMAEHVRAAKEREFAANKGNIDDA